MGREEGGGFRMGNKKNKQTNKKKMKGISRDAELKKEI